MRSVALGAVVCVLSACGHSPQVEGPTIDVSRGASLVPTSSPEGPTDQAFVDRVVDGDTIIADIHGVSTRVRLIGMDTPESVKPDTPVECFAIAASNFTKHALTGKTVRLEYDVDRYDQYGRTLAYVWLDGRLFDQVLVEAGYARVYTFPPNVRYVDRFVKAERDAREHDRGLWNACRGSGWVPS